MTNPAPVIDRSIIDSHWQHMADRGYRTDRWRAEFQRRIDTPKLDWERDNHQRWQMNIEAIDKATQLKPQPTP